MSTALPPKPRVLAPKKKVAIIASRYNEEYTDALVENTIQEFGELSPSSKIDLIRVPGAFEVPVTVAAALDKDSYDCVIALGLIIRGSTAHADLIASSITDSLQQLAINHLTPVIHEVLLVENDQQAKERCQGEGLNRGIEAARAAAGILDVFAEINKPTRTRTAARNG